MSDDVIRPRTLKGFRDFLPDAATARESMIGTAVEVFRRYGFGPIDTPALEYAEILLGKGGDETEKQTYRFRDHGGRDVALRFDLTVPFARFAAEHVRRLGTPFKRYHVGTVWRGENTQRGRYREFLQCDYDTVGTESALADLEILLVTHDLFAALGFERFTIRFSDRRILSGLLEHLGLGGHDTDVLRALDKLRKIGTDRVRTELAFLPGADEGKVDAILDLAGMTGSPQAILEALPARIGVSEKGTAGLSELHSLVDGLVEADVTHGRIELDLSIARGLDYYTGMVFETYLDDLPDIGSCCSGGRYDDLASLYTKDRLPGVGGSLGVDRLLAAMEELEMGVTRSTWAPVLVTVFDEAGRGAAIRTATALRRAGIAVEVYPEARKLGAQLKYANERGHRLAVIAGPAEREAGVVQVKDLATGESTELATDDIVATCTRLLASD